MKTSNFFIIIALIIVILFSYNFFQNNSLFFAVGDSMQPTFTGCTLVMATKVFNPYEINDGEIIVLNVSGVDVFNDSSYKEITHRVYENKVDIERITTRGDNESVYEYPTQVDGWFEYYRVLGVVKNYYNLPLKFCEIKKKY